MEAAPVKKKSQKKKVETYLEVIAAINGLHPGLPPWPHKFHVYEPETGIKELLLENHNRVVTHVNDNALTSAIVSYCNSSGKPKLYLTNRDAQEVARMWINMTTAIEKPIGVSFKSDPGLAFHRVDFDLPQNASFDTPPLFEEFLTRCGNKIALCAFIGSLFDEKANKQQYLYIHGEGGNGKGALVSLLRRVLGPSSHGEVAPAKNKINNFWTSTFIGKRLVVFNECDQPDFPASGFFKSLSGGDAIRIEKKNKEAYSTELNCKFIFLSNEELSISSSIADQRRAIFCKVEKIKTKEKASYHDDLYAEAPKILRECIDIYKQVCPEGGSIPVETMADEQASVIDEKYYSMFDKHFKKSACGYVTASEIQLVFAQENINSTNLMGKYLQFWTNNLDLKRKQVNINEITGEVTEISPDEVVAEDKNIKKRWAYFGMSKKPMSSYAH